MRVEDVQQRFSYFREIIVDLLVDASAEKGEGLDQPLGMGVFTFIRFQQESAGNFGVLSGKFHPHLPDKREFPFIII
jgi:hypothetical protein